MTAKEQIEKAERVVAYSKSIGFEKATIAFWDKDNTECGFDSLDLLRECLLGLEDASIELGVFLNGPEITLEHEYDEEEQIYKEVLKP